MTGATKLVALVLLGFSVGAGAQTLQPIEQRRQTPAQSMGPGQMAGPMMGGQQPMMSNSEMQRQMLTMMDGCRRMMDRMPQMPPSRR